MNQLCSLVLILSLLSFSTSSVAAESFSIPKYQSLLCDLAISAHKKAIKSGRSGGNKILSECQGYEGKAGNQNNFSKASGLFKRKKKKPARVISGGKGAEVIWESLHLIGTPIDIMNELLNENAFCAASEELNKRPENIRKNKGKKIIIERH